MAKSYSGVQDLGGVGGILFYFLGVSPCQLIQNSKLCFLGTPCCEEFWILGWEQALAARTNHFLDQGKIQTRNSGVVAEQCDSHWEGKRRARWKMGLFLFSPLFNIYYCEQG